MPCSPDRFKEYTVEVPETGELKFFDEWVGARRWIIENVWAHFHPFIISCVQYEANGDINTLWEVEWTAPDLKATREDMRYLRMVGAQCVRSVLKWA